jgi:O104-antigen biosynthesis beta-1,3-galactosyltransferase
MSVRLSVLMSVYFKESSESLRQCLESLASQTLRADEVVLVEDGPLGESLRATIAQFRDALSIVSLPLPRQVGLGQALIRGLDKCRGEYVARMDSDDVCVPERFEKQMKFLKSHPEVDVIGGTIAEFERDCSAPSSIRQMPGAGLALRRFARFRNPINHVTAVFLKASVMRAGNYEPCRFFQDYYLWAKMLAKGYCLRNMKDILVYVRCGNGMQKRRGGLDYWKQEIHLQRYLRELGIQSTIVAYLNIALRFPIRLAPSWMRALCYQCFLRRRPNRGLAGPDSPSSRDGNMMLGA